MKMKLIALALIAAGTVASVTNEVASGAEFEVDASDGEKLIADGLAKAVPAASAPPAKKEKTATVRVLYDCAHGKVNDVVELGESIAKEAEKQGLVDTNKAAVAYALTLDQNKPKA